MQLMGREDFSTVMVMYMKESGSIIRLMDTEFMFVRMDPVTRDSGRKIYSMDLG